jgi:ATP-dependent helicase YprA (DUF1998 family)
MKSVQSKFDPIEIAREIERSYATDFIGDRNVLFAGLLKRYGDPKMKLESKLANFVRMKGPYMQALTIPKWSNLGWAQFATSVTSKYTQGGLDQELVDLFTRLGFRKLYAYQEKTISAVLKDENVLVVAGTGRGKTESWLIPIFQFILAAKRGKVPAHPPKSVKAILIYPTKALAQDQLKRLIRYLFELNKNMPPEERISIGVYDGDTPSVSQQEYLSYLHRAFKYFKCPNYDSSRALCRDCRASKNGGSLIAERVSNNAPRLFVPTHECREAVPLEFIHLTREDIIDSRVDILLTNPDIINFRLVNVNGDNERNAFVKEPKYLVLDEIHTLTGLFGSFVSLLMKRFIHVRKNLIIGDKDDLAIVGASATVKNKKEIFSKIIPPMASFELVEEEHENIMRDLPAKIPSFLMADQFTKEDVIGEAADLSKGGRVTASFVKLFDAFKIDHACVDKFKNDHDLEIGIKERLFESMTSMIKETPDLDILRALHSTLSNKAMTPDEMLDYLVDRYRGLGQEQLRNLMSNFFALGELSGILENRVHLFSWPLDGYYSCINCGTIYESPQAECEKCYHHFISHMVICNKCGEDALESWFCPACLKLSSLAASTEGRPTYFEPPLKCKCTGEEIDCIKVVWRPYFYCPKCQKYTRRDSLHRCEKCNSEMIFDESGSKLLCTNPTCRHLQLPKSINSCPECGTELKLLAEEKFKCPVCGKEFKTHGETSCACGSPTYPVLELPWVCGNDECNEVIVAEKPPASCKCGAKNFYLAGVFQIPYAFHCPICKADFVVDSCGNAGHKLEKLMHDSLRFQLIDQNMRIRSPTRSRRAVPCYHRHAAYGTNRYKALARSPNNVAVTSAQYALRGIVDGSTMDDLQEHLKKSKILSFADSHSDMEELCRDFQEPETIWFLDQLLIHNLADGERTLQNLYHCMTESFESMKSKYPGKELADFLRVRDKQTRTPEEELLNSEVDKRLLAGNFYGHWEKPRLVREGIVDIKIDLAGVVQLSDNEKTFLGEMYKNCNADVETLSKGLNGKLKGQFDNVLEQLKQKGLVVEVSGWRGPTDTRVWLRISPKRINCALTSAKRPIAWNPITGDFYPTIERQLGEDLSGCIDFITSYEERREIFKPFFSKTSYRVGYSSPALMVSETYKGNTPRGDRRELEYQFKYGYYPNFLSSGPAMELGIDIGDLDILCLFGTPPNTNSYLQRIGRAGRETKKSLVFSVSKRNPIDYYYYRNPLELVQSSAQPVPINEHNPEVTRISLVWALFDYVATKFWVPWRKQRHPDGDIISDGEETVRKESSATAPDNILNFTSVYSSKNASLNMGRSLEILGKLVNDNKSEARDWLKGMLNYSYCPRCGQHYPPEYTGKCSTPGCSETTVRASEKFADRIEYALESFKEIFGPLPKVLQKQMRKDQHDLFEKESELEAQIDAIEASDKPTSEKDVEVQKLRILKNETQERRMGLDKQIQDIEKMSYSQTQEKSKHRKYVFKIRGVEDGVEIRYYEYDPKVGRYYTTETRDMGMALREYHPYAVTTHAKRKRVACQFYFDDWREGELKERFPDLLICTKCQMTYSDLGKTTCDKCGGELRILQTKVARRIDVYSENCGLRLDAEKGSMIRPLSLHALTETGRTVKKTFPNSRSKVIEFLPLFSGNLENNGKNKIGTLEYGEIKLATVVDSYQSEFEEGFVDPYPRYFELCGVDGCNSIVSQKENHLCSTNGSHDVTRKKYVQLASIFTTYGIKLATSDKDQTVAHTLAHGIRIGLQGIAGVQIRSVGEVVEDDFVYVHDSEPGGSGVTELLIAQEDGKYANFDYVVNLIRKHLADCKCDNGCPHCVYQYGCAAHNELRSLSRNGTKSWMQNGVRLVERSAGEA